ncbi:MAG: ATP-binding cassette domain-containing protein [Thaumarchaeota archaeon]|nr:ATP-binding cassette domain-containing protein [Nitrososphaerota archaeon]
MGTSRPAARNVNLEIGEGEIVILAGPSGCGKSTVLKSLNGLIPHLYSGSREGTVIVDGHDVAETQVSEVAKKVGFVFQNPENQIFMFSVERDVAFALENLGFPRDEIRRRVDWALDLMGIQRLARQAPHELSDGQRQRVAIAGVLAMTPKVLILDEPTSLLDPLTARELVLLVKRLHDELGITVLVVEHRLDLLAGIASRIIVMDRGTVAMDGSPREVLARKEALTIGVGVPTVTRLYGLLTDHGLNLGQAPLRMEELAEAVNRLVP